MSRARPSSRSGLLGGAGAVARLLLDGAVSARAARRRSRPARSAVNLLGSFVLGVLVGAGTGEEGLRLLATGLLGSFTTFSTWMFESAAPRRGRRGRPAAANIAVSLVAGVALAWVGHADRGARCERADGLKLTVFFGERDRLGGRFLADRVIDELERRRACEAAIADARRRGVRSQAPASVPTGC